MDKGPYQKFEKYSRTIHGSDSFQKIEALLNPAIASKALFLVIC